MRQYAQPKEQPLTLSCFINGHVIPAGHWYRNPQEGTRVCGNVGYWLDLAVHVLSWGALPDRWRITIAYSDDCARDDNLSIALASERGDLVSIVLTARGEPFEGINETINFQCGDLIAKIDDFRTMTVWKGSHYKRHRYWPKDVGHNAAILQPFSDGARDWHEVELSTLLMLVIMEMVLDGTVARDFSFSEEWKKIEAGGATAE